MSKHAKPPASRLGRGLRSLISVDLPAEEEGAAGEVSHQPTADTRPERDEPTGELPDARPTDASEERVAESALREIPLDHIVPNPHQPRRQFDEAGLAELAASMKGAGLIQPVVVRRAGDRFELIAGERRWRAAKLAKLATVPALVREVDAPTQAQMALVENIQRQDLNAVDRANAYKSLIDQLGLTQAELAMRLGEDRSRIAHYLRLLDLAPPVQEMVRDEKLTLGHAKLLAGVEDPAEQERIANLVLSQELSVRNLERVLQTPEASKATRAPVTEPSAHLQSLEKTLSRQLGMRVQIRAGAKKSSGRMVVHYASLDQFDDLMSRLGVSPE